MDPRENLLRIYRELADWYERQRQPQLRDRFLVLAADAALTAGRPDEAERLRVRLLKVNPHHMLKPYGSLAQALKTPDVHTYVKDLRVNYPADVAEDLLRTLQADDKRPAAPAAPFDGSVTAPLAPTAENELFFDSKEPEPDLARVPAPGRAPVRPQPIPPTMPLKGPGAARPVAAARPAPRSEPAAPRRPLPAARPVEPPPAPARPAVEPPARGSWMAALLFLVVVAVGAALAAFTFLRPYLPPGWLP